MTLEPWVTPGLDPVVRVAAGATAGASSEVTSRDVATTECSFFICVSLAFGNQAVSDETHGFAPPPRGGFALVTAACSAPALVPTIGEQQGAAKGYSSTNPVSGWKGIPEPQVRKVL